jgi:hypothetical protein
MRKVNTEAGTYMENAAKFRADSSTDQDNRARIAWGPARTGSVDSH